VPVTPPSSSATSACSNPLGLGRPALDMGLTLGSVMVELKFSVGSGMEDMVSKQVRPIRTAHSRKTHRPTRRSLTGLRFLSKQTIDFEVIIGRCLDDTEFKRLRGSKVGHGVN